MAKFRRANETLERKNKRNNKKKKEINVHKIKRRGGGEQLSLVSSSWEMFYFCFIETKNIFVIYQIK